jgi:hypothetical protein
MSDVAAEVDALWRAVFGEPPCITAAPDLVLKVLLKCTPSAPMPAEAWRETLLAAGDAGPAQARSALAPATALGPHAAMSARKPIAVVQGASTPVIQALLSDFAARASAGARVVGVVEDNADMAGEACGAGRLVSLTNGQSFDIFQDLGAASGACRLDAAGVVAACEAALRDIAAGCDLLVLSKFAKVEAERGGLAAAFAAAIEGEIPVLTAVSPKFMAAWTAFAAPLFEVLPPQAEAIEAWWRAVRPEVGPDVRPSSADQPPAATAAR